MSDARGDRRSGESHAERWAARCGLRGPEGDSNALGRDRTIGPRAEHVTVKHGTVAFLFQTSLTDFPANPPTGYGYGLPVVYLVWIAVILILAPACRWFANLKARRRDPWLSYL